MKRSPEPILFSLIFSFLLTSPQMLVAEDEKPKHEIPDLSGNYNIATLTPLQRPRLLGETANLYKYVADFLAWGVELGLAFSASDSDPNREAPPVGGDGSQSAAGNVGGYNTFWIDVGDRGFMLDDKYRTSIIVEPSNGRMPEMTNVGTDKRSARLNFFRPNKGEAWWLKEEGEGPYDDPELRPLGERCLLGFGSTAGPPMLPVLYNNIKRIVQTEDHVLILNEMVHDTRIIRLNKPHLPEEIRKWMGDSVGHWEGDTLVVDTTNFTTQSGLFLATESLHVTERFKRIDEDTLLYSFTVDDPAIWTKPWSGEYPWPQTQDQVFEYACHEGNYALGNIMRGARMLENDVQNENKHEAENEFESGE